MTRQFSLDFELGTMASIAAELLNWHNPELWNTKPDDPARTAISKWRTALAEVVQRVDEMPKSDTKIKAITGLHLLSMAMPTEAGPTAAALLARESNKARLINAIGLLSEAETMLAADRPPLPVRPKKQQLALTKSNLAKRLGVKVSTFREKTKGIITRAHGQHGVPVKPGELQTLYQAEVLNPDQQLELKRLLQQLGLLEDGRLKAQKKAAAGVSNKPRKR